VNQPSGMRPANQPRSSSSLSRYPGSMMITQLHCLTDSSTPHPGHPSTW
jgi:hypothetical protein